MRPLRIDLVPSTAWWSNVRSQVTRSQWEKCKRFARAQANGKCAICKKGSPRPLETHEIWAYDDEHQIQTLAELVAICYSCHRVLHIGRSETVYPATEVFRLKLHMAEVNRWVGMDAQERVEAAIANAYAIWSIRSTWQWGLDVSLLTDVGIDLPRYAWGPHERVTV